MFYCLSLTFFSAIAGEEEITLWATQDFLKNCLVDEKVPYVNQSVMQALKETCEVRSTCGGAFITSINKLGPLKANEKKNWFYYVNGIMAHVGAKEYYPEPGDIIWWDFHRWDEGAYISAVIGAYPQPFLSGYGGEAKKTLILHTASLKHKAGAFKKSIEEQGVKGIELKPYDNIDIKKQNSMLIVIGSWQDLSRHKAIWDIYRNYRKAGLFIKFEKDKLQIMDINGKTQKELEKAAAIVGTKRGFGSDSVIWFIIGTDDDGVEAALDILINEPERIKFYSGAVVTSGEILNVPLSIKY